MGYTRRDVALPEQYKSPALTSERFRDRCSTQYAPERSHPRDRYESAAIGASSTRDRTIRLFDARYFNGPVYATTGSPYYARFPSPAEQVTLANPTRFYQPRRIEFGVRWGWGGE